MNKGKWQFKAFTLIELLLVIALIGTLLLTGIPIFANIANKVKINKAITDIAFTARAIEDYLTENGSLPETLAEVGRDNILDSWGNPYQYLVILGKKKSEIKAKWRKDRFLVPLNGDFDLYSMGKDGDSKAPLTAKASRDDIVRANNGGYIGLGSKY